ncbi:hypothetical protein [Lactiplantibacillus plantarum]|uniref:hypothetical protein n=1 Tax=Lactiplantibacillus plantarum TaxID=1590 RepID=UPI0021A70B39|nr:hypothetical protein [Lactiplantibacillus plantarum]MCT3206034.1 hypothetical protein [Lactiplantibacillus plantarum]MCT3220961.1 hypothetical protein [Lactiplantibacillus plantarum]
MDIEDLRGEIIKILGLHQALSDIVDILSDSLEENKQNSSMVQYNLKYEIRPLASLTWAINDELIKIDDATDELAIKSARTGAEK